jgi:hypothetical protein
MVRAQAPRGSRTVARSGARLTPSRETGEVSHNLVQDWEKALKFIGRS